MADSDKLYIDWELRGKLEDQIKEATKSVGQLQEALEKALKAGEKPDAGKTEKNIQKNAKEATEALYKLMEVREKAAQALSRNTAHRNEELWGFDDVRLQRGVAKLDEIISKVTNVGAEAAVSANAIKNLLASLDANIVMKDVKSNTKTLNDQMDKEEKDRAKAIKDAAKEAKQAAKDEEDANARNAAAQEKIKDALAKIATARANLANASKDASDQEKMHAQLLGSLLDRLSEKLAKLKGQFLGEKGALEGVLGSGFLGLMRNVNTSISNMSSGKMNISGMTDEEWEKSRAFAEQEARRKEIVRTYEQEYANAEKVNQILRERQAMEAHRKAREQAKEDAETKAVADQINRELKAREELNQKLDQNRASYAALEKIKLDTESQQRIANIKDQNAEYTALTKKLTDIANLMARVKQEENALKNGTIKNPTLTRDAITKELDAIQRRYNEALAQGKVQEENAARARRALASASEKAAQATRGQAEAYRGLLGTFKEVENAGKRTNRMLDQMATSLSTYVSFYGLKRLLGDIVTIGGQFEIQHVALQNILGDIQEANILFTQIQGLAVESPKTFMELTAYAKQLSAYQIPAEELFDTTKRLADLSSGLGIDMKRLILAYGQVRSAAVLRGQELRQFTEAGIPMVQALADKFTQMNGKLTTTADVFALISKRAVPFEMVKEVLWDMTSQGGQFFNMQAELADTLYGKYQKLQDTWQIMLGRIADGKGLMGAFLRETVEGLVFLANSMNVLMPLLSSVGLARLGKGLSNQVGVMMESQEERSLRTMRLAKEKQANLLLRERITMGRELTAQEWEIVRAKGRLTEQDYVILFNEGRLSEHKMGQLALDGKINQTLAMRLALMKGYTKEQIRQMANGNLQMLQQSQMGLKGMWQAGGLMGVLTGGGKALGSSVFSFLGGWPGIIMTAIGAAMSLYSYISGKNEELSQKGDAMMGHAQKGANQLLSTLDSVESSSDTTNKKIEALENTLIEMGEEGKRIVLESRGLEDIGKRFDMLTEKAKAYQKALEGIGTPRGKALYEEAIDESDIEDDVKEYENTRNLEFKQTAQMAKYSAKYQQMIDALKLKHRELNEELKSSNLFENLRTLLSGKYGNEVTGYFAGPARAALMDYYNTIRDTNEAFEDIRTGTIPKLMDSMKAMALDQGLDLTKPFEKLSETEKETLRTIATNFASSLENASDDTRSHIANWISQGFYANLYLTPVVGQTIETGYADDLRKLQEKYGVNIWNSQQRKNAAADMVQFGKDNGKNRKALQEQKAALEGMLKGPLNQKGLEEVNSQLSDVNAQLDAMAKLEAEGIPFISPKTKGGGGSSKKDTQLEALKNRVDLYKKFFSELENARKLYGTGALDYLKENGFSSVFGWNLSDVTNYRQSIDQLMQGFVANTEARSKFVNSVDADKVVQQRKADAEAIKEYVSELQRMMSVMSENYKTYRKWLDLTGDENLAARAAGVTQNTSYADYLREQMQKALSAKPQNTLSVDEVLGLSESDIVEKFGKESGIVAIWDEWRKHQQMLKKEQWDLYDEAIKNAKDYDDKIADINRDLEKQIAAIEALGGGTELIENARRNAAKKISSIKWDQFKDNKDWGRVFGNLDNMPLESIRKMIAAMKEYAKTTKMDVTETKAWYEALEKLTDRKAILDPLGSLADAVRNYQAAHNKRKIVEEQIERTKNNPELSDSKRTKLLNKLQQTRNQLLDQETEEMTKASKAIKSFSSSIGKLGSSLQQLGSSIGGNFGDFMGGIGGMLGDLSSGMSSIGDLATAMSQKGFTGAIGKVSAAIGIISSTISMVQKLDSILPNSESLYEKYAERQRKINQAREAIEDYEVESLKRQQKNQNWLYSNGLSEMRSNGYVRTNLLKNYANTQLAAQEIYQDKRSGLAKWGPAIVGAIVAIVITAVTWGLGSVGGAAVGSGIAAALGSAGTAAVGAAVAAGAGAAIGTALRSAGDQIFYKEGQTAARNNLRVQTQHSSFWRGEKTQNLEDWVRENYGKELFNKDNYDLIDVELAKKLLENGPTLVGETRETLERLVEIAEQIQEIQDQIHDYVGNMFSPLIDNMTDSLWDWLKDGTNMMDSFYDYASDTFANLAKDAVKSFLKINLLDNYTKTLEDIFNAYSFGLINEAEMMLGVAHVAGEIGEAFENLSPVLQELGTVLADAFEYQGYDVVGNTGNSSASNSIKNISESTADLLASYINAIRADVSANRFTLMQLLTIAQTQSEMPAIARAQLVQLQQIARNTMRNADAADSIYTLLHSLAPDGQSIRVK